MRIGLNALGKGTGRWVLHPGTNYFLQQVGCLEDTCGWGGELYPVIYINGARTPAPGLCDIASYFMKVAKQYGLFWDRTKKHGLALYGVEEEFWISIWNPGQDAWVVNPYTHDIAFVWTVEGGKLKVWMEGFNGEIILPQGQDLAASIASQPIDLTGEFILDEPVESQPALVPALQSGPVQLTIIDQTQEGLAAFGRKTCSKRNSTQWIVWHQIVNGHGVGYWDGAKLAQYFRSGRGWDSPGYTYLLDSEPLPNGTVKVWQLWPEECLTYGVGYNYNTTGIHISYVDVPGGAPPNDAQLYTFLLLTSQKMQQYGIPADHVVSHAETALKVRGGLGWSEQLIASFMAKAGFGPTRKEIPAACDNINDGNCYGILTNPHSDPRGVDMDRIRTQLNGGLPIVSTGNAIDLGGEFILDELPPVEEILNKGEGEFTAPQGDSNNQVVPETTSTQSSRSDATTGLWVIFTLVSIIIIGIFLVGGVMLIMAVKSDRKRVGAVFLVVCMWIAVCGAIGFIGYYMNVRTGEVSSESPVLIPLTVTPTVLTATPDTLSEDYVGTGGEIAMTEYSWDDPIGLALQQAGIDMQNHSIIPYTENSPLAPVFWNFAVGQLWGEQIPIWANTQGLDPNVVATFMLIESGGNPLANCPGDKLGYDPAAESYKDKGLFQLNPKYFANGCDFNTNVTLGPQYIRTMLDASGGNLLAAAAGYNGGPKAREWFLASADPTSSIYQQKRAEYVTFLNGLGYDGARKAGIVEKYVKLVSGVYSAAKSNSTQGLEAFLSPGSYAGSVAKAYGLPWPPVPTP